MIILTPIDIDTGLLQHDDALTFERDMLIKEWRGWSSVISTVTPTLRGVVKQESTRSEKGRPLTLEASDGYGYQTLETVIALETMASVKGAIYELLITPTDREDSLALIKPVSFRTELAQAVLMEPAYSVDGVPPLTTFCKGSIFFMVEVLDYDSSS